MTAPAKRYRGPNGLAFVLDERVSQSTVDWYVESGEWTPVEESAPAPVTEEKTVRKPRQTRKTKTDNDES